MDNHRRGQIDLNGHQHCLLLLAKTSNSNPSKLPLNRPFLLLPKTLSSLDHPNLCRMVTNVNDRNIFSRMNMVDDNIILVILPRINEISTKTGNPTNGVANFRISRMLSHRKE